MAFATDERLLLEQSLERFAGEFCSLASRRTLVAADLAFTADNWSALADMGVLALPVPEAEDGLGGSLSDVMTVARLLASGLSLEPFLPCAVAAGRLLSMLHGDGLRKSWLTRSMSGEAIFALAHLERGDRGRSDVREVSLVRTADGWSLSGSKIAVPIARMLDGLIVTARDETGALLLCLVPGGAPGMRIRSYRLVDGQLAGEVVFDQVRITGEMLVQGPAVEHILQSVLTYSAAVAAADSLGCMQELLRRTAGYLNDRRQFGQPLARFQALKHRLVDCHTAVEQAAAMIELAGCEAAPGWSANVAAAKAFVDGSGIRLGHEAMQMHGAMGLTDELAISHYHKRILANAVLHGDEQTQIENLCERHDVGNASAPSAALPFAQVLTPHEAEFRAEVREFLAANVDDGVRNASRRLTCTFPEKDVTVEWQRRLNKRGWLAPLWPAEYGGTGWSATERFLFEYECAVGGAPERIPMGLRYVGPIVAQFGSEWQKTYFLPRILSSEHYWAQGFSEPGAGSDLAAIKTSAVRDGDEYVVNGSKIWTTNAHFADWIFCIVRTESTGKPQEGISFLLIDLRTAGIRIEPIPLLAVDHEVNQVFFDNVRVPARNLVGEPGQGWQYAKFLLELERGGTLACGRVRFEFNAVKEQLAAAGPRLRQDKAWLHRLARLEVRLMALEMLEFRCARAMTNATDPGVGGSMTKLVSSELQQDVTRFGADVAGLAGLELAAVRPLGSAQELGYPGFDLDLVAMPRYLNARAATIYAGSSEIQREIIAKHVLGFRS
jgi:alkylation response protein AidB-like acyl-CoA dehydrogenase